MFTIKLFFCFASAFAIITGANSFHTSANGVKFTCVEVCYGHLRGKTYSCDLYSPQGMVTAIVRMITDLNWRFYVIPRTLPESRFCQRVADADNYYMSGKASCSSSSYRFRANFENTHQIDSRTLQSNLRLEHMKRLLKEINNDTIKVLNDLKITSSNKGLRYNRPKSLNPMKTEIKILVERLVDHLSQASQLTDDIKYHEESDSSGVYSGLPNFSNGLGPFSNNIIKYKANKVSTNSHTFNYTEHNTQTVKNHNHHNAAYDRTNYYDQEVAYDTSNTYNIDSNNDKHTTYNDVRYYGTNLSFQKHGKTGEGTPKVEEVKELVSKVKEESSKLLNALKNGSLANNPKKKRRTFAFLLKLLSELVKLVNHDHWYESDTYVRDEGNIGTARSENYRNYPRYSSPSVGKSNERKFTHDTSDGKGECLLCTMILKDLCNDGKIVVCNENRCCWQDYNPFHCMSSLNDKRAVTCYNSLFYILQSAKM